MKKIAIVVAATMTMATFAWAGDADLTLKNSAGSKLVIKNINNEGFEFDFEGVNPKTKKSCGDASGFVATWVQPKKTAKWMSNGGCEMTFTMLNNDLSKISIKESKGCIPGCGTVVVEKQISADLSGDYRKTTKGSFDSVALKKTTTGYAANLSASYGANFGELTIDIPQGSMDRGKYTYKTDGCNLNFIFKSKTITVSGHSDGTCDAGQNVSFNGTYKRKN